MAHILKTFFKNKAIPFWKQIFISFSFFFFFKWDKETGQTFEQAFNDCS